MANNLLQKWKLDSCQKGILVLLVIEDKAFWVARGDNVPVYAKDFTEMFNQEVRFLF